MSRAVQRKRKRLSKKQISSVLNNGTAKLTSEGDSDIDSDNDDGGHILDNSNELNMDLDETAEDTEQAREVESVFNVRDMTVFDILHLKDVDEVTSAEKASLLLHKLYYPMTCKEFFAKHWEKRPIACTHEDSSRFKKLLSRKTLETTFGKQLLFEHSNIVFFSQRELTAKPRSKETDEEDGDETGADAEGEDGDDSDEENAREVPSAEIWSKFKSGHSIRLLTPQMYHDGVWKLLSALEHEFQCRVSAEAVLAPLSASTGKSAAVAKAAAAAAGKGAAIGAASYDNTNSIVLQLEGHSRWRIAANPHADLQMPLQAGCVSLKDIDFWSKPEVDVTLSPGDTLYIPKGWVYQQDNNGSPVGDTAAAAPGGDHHSLHLKVCTHHGTTSTVADLLELVVPQALAEAVQSRAELRRALPRSYHQHLGIAQSETEGDAKRAQLRQKIAALMEIVTNKAVDILDPAADQLVKQFIAGRLPVPLSPQEEACTAAGAPLATIFPYTQLRMLRPGLATAVVEDGKLVVYHCMDNSRELFGTPLNPMEFELDDGPAIEALLAAYPEAVTVSDLEHPSEELDDKLGVAQALYKEGFLLIADEVSRPAVMNDTKDKHDKQGKKSKKAKTAGKSVDPDDDPF